MEEAARKALELGLCDHCLGRLFGKKGHGMTNDERGRALRSYFEVDGTTDPDSCSMCEGLFGELDDLAELVVQSLGEYEFSTFMIGCRVDDELVGSESSCREELDIDCGEEAKSELNREVGKRVEALTGAEADMSRPDITAIMDVRYDTVELDVRSLFVYGRYNKLQRGIPQTRWPCRKCRGTGCDRCDGTGKMYQTSVEEVVCGPLMTMADGREHSFHGLGREDVDVRMLGTGRPFVAEVHGPKRRSLDLDSALSEINSSDLVQVRDLSFSDRRMVKSIKAMRCDKEYESLIETAADEGSISTALADLRGTTIHQRTPERVNRRRADLVRKRTVRDISLVSAGDGQARINVVAEAGTYIKELLHGDSGRTDPSLASLLGTDVTVRELDVLDIACDPLADCKE